MLAALQVVAALAAGLFAGAALYVTLVEHPVRAQLDPAAALAQWTRSYVRATRMQAPLALIAAAAGAAAWLAGGSVAWLVAAVVIVAVVPFTLLVVMPVNRALESVQATPAQMPVLLERWGLLHGVRTALGLAATVIMLAGLAGAW